jgi:ABC-type sugar transport system ATPase subunit
MNILEMNNINISFKGVQALRNVSLSVETGEVHGLLGANGAGKSTLMKILSGVLQPDGGEIRFKGEKVSFSSPLAAQAKGIAIIHQELSLVQSLSVAENIFLGRLHGKSFNINWKEVYQEAEKLLSRVGAHFSPKTLVRDLSVAEMQLVEIAKALSFQAHLVIMDEPSAVLSGPELERLFDTIESLTQNGVTVIYISHRLEEIFRICDRITIMRDGQVIETGKVAETTREQIIQGIVGRSMNEEFPAKDPVPLGDVVLSVRNLTLKGRFENISFDVRSGEIVGLAGLVGAGRTEIVRCIFGADRFDQGEIIYKGKPLKVKNPGQAISSGIALVPEDRKNHGLITRFSLRLNLTMSNLKKVSRWMFLQRKKERMAGEQLVEQLQVKTPSIEQLAVNLSGGNQQKVVLGKSLFSDADLLILDEPTRGVDVGAKREIYDIILGLAKSGKSVILISSEWEELLALSDRLIVLHEGKLKGELAGAEATSEKIMQLALA